MKIILRFCCCWLVLPYVRHTSLSKFCPEHVDTKNWKTNRRPRCCFSFAERAELVIGWLITQFMSGDLRCSARHSELCVSHSLSSDTLLQWTTSQQHPDINTKFSNHQQSRRDEFNENNLWIYWPKGWLWTRLCWLKRNRNILARIDDVGELGRSRWRDSIFYSINSSIIDPVSSVCSSKLVDDSFNHFK